MITLFHAGTEVIEKPDIYRGRKNADFGQGFYTTDNRDFACIWVRDKSDTKIIINKYELDETSLKIRELERDRDWFEYIFANRRLRPDIYEGADIIKGPIANDTIFDTFGIITSGFLSLEEAMKLMLIGPCFMQIVLRTPRAASNLKYIGSEVLTKDIMEASRKEYVRENKEYQAKFAEVMQNFN